MRPINVTLDATTWELAKQKTNFSAWVRAQLRSERNQKEQSTRYCTYCMRHHPRENFYDHQCITISEDQEDSDEQVLLDWEENRILEEEE